MISLAAIFVILAASNQHTVAEMGVAEMGLLLYVLPKNSIGKSISCDKSFKQIMRHHLAEKYLDFSCSL